VRVQNAASNMADYGVKPGWQGDAGSHARAGGVGTETGVGSSRLSSVFERKPRFPDEFEAQPRRRCCTCRSACESRRSVNWRASGQRYSDQRCRLGDGAHPECVLDAMARTGGDASGFNLGRTSWSGVVARAKGLEVQTSTARHRG
jgi:hypothetical protein